MVDEILDDRYGYQSLLIALQEMEAELQAQGRPEAAQLFAVAQQHFGLSLPSEFMGASAEALTFALGQDGLSPVLRAKMAALLKVIRDAFDRANRG